MGETESDSADHVIIHRLNTIISLLLDHLPADSASTTADKIYKLSDLGLRPGEIGRILSKPAKYITATLHRRKTRKRKK